MVLNATMCMRYEIVPWGGDMIASPMHCLMGGVIFSGQHEMLDSMGISWMTQGKVVCESDPPVVGAIEDWVEREKARVARSEPQTK